MDSQSLKNLFQDLLKANTEDEVHKIVQKNTLFNDSKNWFPYGGRDLNDRGNFATFENQQSNPIAALVEKITNSIDALLLKKCYEAGIDPVSDEAPKSMTEAVGLFYGIKNGDFSEVGHSKKREIARDIQIIASGDKPTPSLLIYDNGEGQHPKDFPTTFLSLHRSNKNKILFVQGKYNMGSTGAVVFCGTHRYQLIASRRAPSLVKQGTPNPFGFTLVRRHPLTDDQEQSYRSSWYEYFTINGEIATFLEASLDVGLNDQRKFESGAIVKMYSYELPSGYRSDATLDLWRGLNQFLYSPALPCLISDTRYDSSAKHETKVMQGNRNRILIDNNDQKEELLSLSMDYQKMGKVNIEVAVFKSSVKHKEFVDKKPIIFTVNGQVHGIEDRSFISQKLGLSFLKDSLLVQVDCTGMKTSFRQDLFMANRTTLKESPALEYLLEKLVDLLKSNETLRKLNERRRQGLLQSSDDDEQSLRSIMQSMPIDSAIIDMLRKDKGLTLDIPSFNNKHKIVKDGNIDLEIKKPLNRYPAEFRVNNASVGEGRKFKAIPLNGKGVIEFGTDVENEYLLRPNDPGEFQLQILQYTNNETDGGTVRGKPNSVADLFDVERSGPTDGTIKVSLRPRDTLSVDDEITLEANLTSPNGDLKAILYVRIAKPSDKVTEKIKKEVEPPSLPRAVRVFQKPENPIDKSWSDWEMDVEDIAHIRIDTLNSLFYVDAIGINMDSSVLRSYLSRNRVKTPRALKEVTDKYFTTMYLHALFLFSILEKMRNSDESPVDKNTDNEDLIRVLMKNYGGFLLHNAINPALLPSD